VRAAVYHGRRDVRIEDFPKRPLPPGQLELEVTRAAICGTDAHEFAAGPRQIPLTTRHEANARSGPLVLGHEFGGRVRAVAPGVEGFEPGDRVVCGAGISCGQCRWCREGRTNLCARYYTLGLQEHGGLAELVNAPASICLKVPDEIDDDTAALAQPQSIALHALNRGRVDREDTVAIIGLGGIGALAAAAASSREVTRIVAIDVDWRRLEVAHALGAHEAINAAEEDPVAAMLELTDGVGADVAIELSGDSTSPPRAIRMVRRGGRVVLVGLPDEPVSLDLHELILREIEVTSSNAHVCSVDLPEALEVLRRPEIADNVIDRVVDLDNVVEEGIQALLDGSAEGKVLVDVSSHAAERSGS